MGNTKEADAKVLYFTNSLRFNVDMKFDLCSGIGTFGEYNTMIRPSGLIT